MKSELLRYVSNGICFLAEAAAIWFLFRKVADRPENRLA